MKVFKQFGMIFKMSTKLTHRMKNCNSINFYINYNQFYKIRPLKRAIPYQHLQRKYCFHYFKGDDSDSESEDIDHKHDIINIILPNMDDVLTIKIRECNSLQDIFVLLRNKDDQLNWQHIAMALAMIREFQIIYYRICLFERNLNSSDIPAKNSFENIVTNIDFLNLLNLIEKHYEFMNIQCLSYSLLCLYKIGVDMHCTTIEKLSQKLNNMLVTIPVEKIDSCILSRYVVSLTSYKNLKSVYNFKNIWPIILKKIDLCDSYDDIKHISICLYSFPLFINESNAKIFVNKIENVLFNKPYNSDKLKCSIKVLKLLNSPYWPTQNVTLIRSLLLDLQNFIRYLSFYDMIQIQMIIMKQYEPYQLFKEINTMTSKWLSKAEIDTDITVLQLLSCIIPSTLTSQKDHVESLLRKQFLLNNNFPKLYIGPLFNIIRNLKTADIQICDAYWLSVLNCLINGQPSLREHHKLLRICNRYMNFNNNLAGTYRHYKFESQMIKWLNEELNYGVSAIIPSKFSKIFSFLISYPNDIDGYDIPEKMVKKILNNIGQYSVYDCYIVSRGLNNAFINRKKKSSLPMFLDQYVRLCTAIDKRCIEIINQEPKISINNLNSIYRGYNHRININDPELFYKMLDKYKQYSSKDFSSKIIRELTSNFIKSNWYDTEVLDKCLEYYKKNHQYLLAESVEKMLSLFFLDGISSESFIEFLPYAAEIINREKCKMSGLHFMKASLALCYFYSLPTSITDYLFSIEFLEKLDNELNNCYAKATYPLKVRQLLMILNRAVCIDYPELDVPWFHTKYCEEFQSLVSKHTGSFYLEVENKLNQVVGKKGYVKTNIFSPYGYKLDFEVNLNSSKKINDGTQSEKLIFLLLNERNLRKTDNEMRGLIRLKQRHLEILGYKVIWIKKSIWNSMFMSEPHAKLSYLKSLIWPNLQKIS